MNSTKYLKSGLLWLFIGTLLTFLAKSSNAQNNTVAYSDIGQNQNDLTIVESNSGNPEKTGSDVQVAKGGICRGKATEKLLKSELDRILDKKKYDIRTFRGFKSSARQSSPGSPCRQVQSG